MTGLNWTFGDNYSYSKIVEEKQKKNILERQQLLTHLDKRDRTSTTKSTSKKSKKRKSGDGQKPVDEVNPIKIYREMIKNFFLIISSVEGQLYRIPNPNTHCQKLTLSFLSLSLSLFAHSLLIGKNVMSQISSH
jgi:hypothetical protein